MDRRVAGPRMKLTREALGLTQREAYEAIGVSKTQWGNYERGVSRPNIEDAVRFSMRFNVSLEWIYLADISSLRMDLAREIERLQKDQGES